MKFSNLMQRTTAFVLAVILIFGGVFTMKANAEIPTDKENDIYSYYLFENFEKLKSTLPFKDDLSGVSASYVGKNTKARGIDWNVLSDRKSVEIKECDMRWWSLSIVEEELYVGFEFESLTDNYTNTFDFCVQTQDAATTSGGLGGAIFSVVSSNGKPYLKAADGKKVASLENKTEYDVVAVLRRGTEKYQIFLNGEPYGEYSLKSAYYSVLALRLNAKAKDDESSFVLDNVSVFTKSRYPQSFSAQAKGKVPDLKRPSFVQKETLLFINNVQISLKEKIVKKNGTAYIPLEELVKAAGGNFKADKNGNITVECGEVKAEVKTGSCTAKVNGEEVSFKDAPEMIGKTVYAPLGMVNAALKVKVWLDETGDMVVITDRKHSSDDILRAMNGRFYMNGEPYYEISFNKFDLCYQTAADILGYDSSFPNEVQGFRQAEEAIKTLSENGFRTIRFFCSCGNDDVLYDPVKKEQYYDVMDKVFDLLDKYGIQANVCLGLRSTRLCAHEYVEGYGWMLKPETETDLIAFRDSESRQFLYSYLDEFITRYKDRHAILMWEMENEGNLRADLGQMGKPGYSLLQLGEFYADCAERIRKIDPEHLITGGDSTLRTAQWHLYLGTMQGKETNDWTRDTQEDRLDALWMINRGLDVISAHTYNWEADNNTNSFCVDDSGTLHKITFTDLMNEARSLGKVYYTGEIAGGIPVPDMPATDSSIVPYQQALLDTIVEEGVQLTHWWSFMSARQGGHTDDTDWNVTPDKHGFTLEIIKKANEDLKVKYVVNAAADDNTVLPDNDFDVTYKAPDGSAGKKFNPLWVIVPCAAALIAAAVVLIVKKRSAR